MNIPKVSIKMEWVYRIPLPWQESPCPFKNIITEEIILNDAETDSLVLSISY